MRSTTPATSSSQAGLAQALAEVGDTLGVTVLPFGSLTIGSLDPSDVDLALVYEAGRRDAALQLREQLRAAVQRHVGLSCDFVVVSREEAERERRQPQLRDDVFAGLGGTSGHR